MSHPVLVLIDEQKCKSVLNDCVNCVTHQKHIAFSPSFIVVDVQENVDQDAKESKDGPWDSDYPQVNDVGKHFEPAPEVKVIQFFVLFVDSVLFFLFFFFDGILPGLFLSLLPSFFCCFRFLRFLSLLLLFD